MSNDRRCGVRRQAVFLVAVTAVFTIAGLLIGSVPVWAQTGTLGTIHGTVSDTSGAALPGVTVTVASPALQIGRGTQVTEPDGTYRFGDLPVGAYKITFELAGFKTFVRDDLRLPVGFVARVDATMAIGGIEETVTVSGQSPVVDQTTTTTSVNITQETLESVPVGRGYQLLLAMTPGVTTAGAPDVGDSALASRSNIQSYGVGGTSTISVEGINISVGQSSPVYYTSYPFEEVQVKTSGNDAEVSTPGISMVSVLKSGSNQFHGDLGYGFERPRFQGSNLTPLLVAQGITKAAPLKSYYEVSSDLGGRLVKDKLWFFVSTNKQRQVSNLLGFASGPGPDGKYLTGDDPLANYENNLTDHAVKISYQANQKNRFIGVWQPMTKYQPERNGGRFVPLASTINFKNTGGIRKGEWQGTLSPRMVVDVLGGYGGNREDYCVCHSTFSNAVPGNPAKFDNETGLYTGAGNGNTLRKRDRWQSDNSVSFFPEHFLGGKHELKVGETLYWVRVGQGTQLQPAGNYLLVYDKLNGVSGTPSQIQIFNAPNLPHNSQDIYATYFKDTWRVTDSLTANLGIRYEYQHAFLTAQSKIATPDFPTLFPAVQVPAMNVQTWNSFVPRIGLAWSLGPSTVVKGSYGRYNAGMDVNTENGFASTYNKNGPVTATYRWSDQDHSGDYTPGEVNLDLNGPDFISISGSTNNVLNPAIKQPMTNELTTGFEHEIMKNLGFRALYVFKNVTNSIVTTNIARPRSAYDIPITRRDPGPDGLLNTADDGGSVAFYDYNAAYRGAAFVVNEQVNTARTDHYQSVEFTVTKRSSGRWFGMGSFWATKNHRWIQQNPDNPNTDFFPLDETWSWASNLSGGYKLPWGVNLGAYLQSRIGVQGQRTYVFRAADPDGGLALKQLSTVTIPLEKFGAQQGPSIKIVNLRASKVFSLHKTKLEVDLEAFNLLNSSAPLSVVYASGPTYGYFGTPNGSAGATGVLAARVGRVGLHYRF